MARYPDDATRFARWLRPLNVLDDGDNKLSPVKLHVWGANLAGFSTVAGAIFAWLGDHAGLLAGIGAIGPLVGGYIGHAHTMHHLDKKERNLQAARMKGL